MLLKAPKYCVWLVQWVKKGKAAFIISVREHGKRSKKVKSHGQGSGLTSWVSGLWLLPVSSLSLQGWLSWDSTNFTPSLNFPPDFLEELDVGKGNFYHPVDASGGSSVRRSMVPPWMRLENSAAKWNKPAPRRQELSDSVYMGNFK